MWVDSHCHLTQLKLSDNDSVEDSIARANSRGVDAFLCIATDIENTESVQQLCQNLDNTWTSAGIHPLNPQPDETWRIPLEQLSQHEKCVAIGETGLDFYYVNDKNQQLWQQQAFAYHIKLSKQLNKPLIIHTRNATTATINQLKQSNLPELPGVIHCFTENLSAALEFLELGFYISFSGIVTFKNAAEIRNAMEHVPLNRILVETDSPYLAPTPHRGKSNLPEYVVDVGRFIAKHLNIPEKDFAQITSENFKKLFKVNF